MKKILTLPNWSNEEILCKGLKKVELLFRSYPKEFVKISEKAIGITEHQNISNLGRKNP
jgi:hypothetical protein